MDVIPVRMLLLITSLLALGPGEAFAQGITAPQADEILKQLRGIRLALARLAMPPTARPATVAAPSTVRMPTVTGYVLGRPDAPLTFVEFADLQCPFCKRFHDTAFDRIKTEYIDKGLLRYVARDFPLDMHPHADLAARASRCAGEQGHFWDVRTTLLDNASRCVVRCPQDVHIADVMYTLKSMAIQAKLYKDSTGPDFSQTFVDMVETYGRSYEFGLATRHYLKHFPMRLPGMAPMGLGMLTKKRMDITPTRIEGMEQLTAILERAKTLEVV